MKTKILMVCLGNICRSPLAEGILKSKLAEELFEVDSAGTGNWHVGQQPDKRSIEVAKKYGIDLSTQRARQIHTNDFEEFDYIYVMDKSNYNDVVKLAPNALLAGKVKLIMTELENNKNSEVPDPYFGERDGFEHVYQMLDNVCDSISEKLNSIHANKLNN